MSIVLITAAVAVTIFLALWGAYDIGKSDGYKKGLIHCQRETDYWKDEYTQMDKCATQAYQENSALKKQLMELNFEQHKEAK